MTFRLNPELAAAMRQLPNQTAFVETVLKDALGRVCPLCHGTGDATGVHLSVSNFKQLPKRRLTRREASQLKALVRLGRELLATHLDIQAESTDCELGFRLARADQLLLSGRIPHGRSEVNLAH